MNSRLALLAWLLLAAHAWAQPYFAISVVDDETGRGVPLVELRTVDQSRYWTDSQGLVAFDAPGLMNQKVFFTVTSDGYEFPADGFGFRGKALVTKPGEIAELRIKRKNLAQRLYRVTGAGIYRDSVRLGRQVPLEHPLLNAQVAGSDSVNSIIFQDRIYWFWGDTNRPAYPLGTFHVPGAVSKLPGQGGLDPQRGVNLNYFTRDDGFVASTCEMPGDGPTWIDGLCRTQQPDGRERLFAKYVKVRKQLEVYQRGLVEFDPQRERFQKVVQYDFAAPLYPHGHSLPIKIADQDYLYFGNPYPLVRVKADPQSLADPSRFEAYTPLKPASTLEEPQIDRDAEGRVRYAWKTNMPAPTAREQANWLSRKLLREDEALLALRDVDGGKPVVAHAGSVTFNPFRNRYVMIAEEFGGTSLLGEIWYAEAHSPLGPWVYARKVVSHARYSFYNPRQHPMFDQEGGRRIFFEGTYSTFFTGIEQPTPLYDYNQILYSLELDDPRLVLPVPIYETLDMSGRQTFLRAHNQGGVAFFALDQPGIGTIALHRVPNQPDALSAEAQGPVAFHVIPPVLDKPRPGTVPLFEWRSDTGRRWYGVEGQAPAARLGQFKRDPQPLARVWRNPLHLEFPLEDD